jgi:uncharacterized protein YbjT (DUF2867 family)
VSAASDSESKPGPLALVAGATGLVGRECLRLLANDDRLAEVRALVRRPLPPDFARARVRECRADFGRLAGHADWFQVDWVFCALGTTLRAAGSPAGFIRVDYDYPLAIARLAREHGARHFLLVSAMGAHPQSRVFYSRVKGELEQALRGLGFPSLTIARPSMLLGEREEFRLGEEIGKRLARLAPARWRPVHAAQVAAALVRAAHAEAPGVRLLENLQLRAAG